MNDKKLNKITGLTQDQKDKFYADYVTNSFSFELDFVINEKPVPYARARAGRNGFYNPKAAVEAKYKNLFKHQLNEEQYKRLSSLMSNDDNEYYVEVQGNFYVPIPESDPIKTAYLKETQVILPDVRNGDIDNYMKLILDALHDVIYTDDKRVISITAHKYYSLKPRSEIHIKIFGNK